MPSERGSDGMSRSNIGHLVDSSSASLPPEMRQKPVAGCGACGGVLRLLTFALRFAIMAAAISLFLFLAGAATLILLHLLASRCHFRRRSSRRSPSISLPSFRYPAGSLTPADCPVCLDTFAGGQKCRSLPVCAHVFHVRCIDTWLARNPVCPVCRRPLAAESARLPRRRDATGFQLMYM